MTFSSPELSPSVNRLRLTLTQSPSYSSNFHVPVQRHHLQSALNEHFRKTLAQRATVNGETSVDLLQGLLFYLAWHHYHLDHRTQQMYQHLQQAIGMVADLHLDEPVMDSGTGEETLLSRQRAYLACYYLSCGLSVLGFNKPQNLHLSAGKLEQIKVQLRAVSTERFNLDCISHAELREMADIYSHNATAGDDIKAPVDLALRGLSTWKSNTLLSPHDHSRLILTYYIHVFIYHRSGPQAYAEPLFHTATSVLDTALFRSTTDLRSMNIVEWAHLLASLVIMARLTAEARELDVHLETLLNETADGQMHDFAPALFGWLGQIVKGMKGWLGRTGRDGEASTFETVMGMTQSLQAGDAMSAATTVVAEPVMTDKDWDELIANWQDIQLPLSF